MMSKTTTMTATSEDAGSSFFGLLCSIDYVKTNVSFRDFVQYVCKYNEFVHYSQNFHEKLFKIYNFIQTSNSKCTLQIIGDHFGVSRERIRQNVLKIVKTIRCNFYKMATVQFYNIIKILNSYDISSFFNFIAYFIFYRYKY